MASNIEPKLSNDEWVIYECLKDSFSPDKKNAKKCNGLREFLLNVHQKITQNLTEKQLLTKQSIEL